MFLCIHNKKGNVAKLYIFKIFTKKSLILILIIFLFHQIRINNINLKVIYFMEFIYILHTK